MWLSETASNIYTNKITELQRKRGAMLVYAAEGKLEEEEEEEDPPVEAEIEG